MPRFSHKSELILSRCRPELIHLFNRVVIDFDCTILVGHRGEKDQNDLKRKGFSRLNFPHSKHNKNPSYATDVIPYPIDWNDRERMTFFAGFVIGTAQGLGYKIRWGGDWNQDWKVRDNVFDDLTHFELINV